MQCGSLANGLHSANAVWALYYNYRNGELLQQFAHAARSAWMFSWRRSARLHSKDGQQWLPPWVTLWARSACCAGVWFAPYTHSGGTVPYLAGAFQCRDCILPSYTGASSLVLRGLHQVFDFIATWSPKFQNSSDLALPALSHCWSLRLHIRFLELGGLVQRSALLPLN